MVDDDRIPSFAKAAPRRSRKVLWAATILTAFVLGIAGGRLYVVSRGPAAPVGGGKPGGASFVSDSPAFLAVEAIQRIQAFSQALEAYRTDRGSLPAAPWVAAYAELTGKKYLSPARHPRKDPWNQAIRYVTSSDRQVFLLLSPGDDGIYQVDDPALSAMLSARCKVEKKPYGAEFGTDLVCCNGLFVSAPTVEGTVAPRP
jgi:hypothetical protein